MVGSLHKGSRLTQAKRFHIITSLLLGSSVAEQVTVNHLVAGSNPARAAIFFALFYLESSSGQRSNFLCKVRRLIPINSAALVRLPFD